MKVTKNELLHAIQNRQTLKPLMGDDKRIELLALPAKFTDSSCSVWVGELADSKIIIKIADGDIGSPFWQMLQNVFGFSIEQNFIHAKEVYTQISACSSLHIAKVLDVFNVNKHPVLIMEFIEGYALDTDLLNVEMVTDLADYLAHMHSRKLSDFGCLASSQASHQEVTSEQCAKWFTQLTHFLRPLFISKFENALAGYPNKDLDEILSHSGKSIAAFVPVMMDLRWDQFAQFENRLVGVFDLDAYVSAPIELDFVILEYLLNKEQLTWFKQAYEVAGGVIPKLSGVRDLYRLLFFAVNALGEEDLNNWLSQSHFFDSDSND